MFEKFFGKQEKTPELQIREAAQREFDAIGVNQPGILRAFEAAQVENERGNLDLSNEQILNIIQDQALSASGPIEDTLYGGAENTKNNIVAEINRLREEHRD